MDYVVKRPYGSHLSHAQGYYDCDNDAYLEWDEVSKSREDIGAWLDKYTNLACNLAKRTHAPTF